MTQHRNGHLGHAEELYKQILHQQPDHPDALHLLGVVEYQCGRYAQAIPLIRKAINLSPTAPMYGNLAQAVQASGDLAGAITLYHQALLLDPKHETSHHNLGLAFHATGKNPEAINSILQAIALKPDYANAYVSLGIVAFDMGNMEEALQCYNTALSLAPNLLLAHNNLGNVFYAQGHYGAAAEHYVRALAIDPNCSLTLSNLGNIYKDQNDFDAAIENYEKAIRIDPNYAPTYNNMGNALRERGQPELAIELYKKALSINPALHDIHSNLLFTMLYVSGLDPDEVFAAHQRFAQQFEAPLKPFWPIHGNLPNKNKRLKIGYVSGDFRDHAVAYFIEPVLAGHDRSQVEIFCYYNHHQQDDVTRRIAALSNHWIPCKGLSDEALAARIREDGIDILVDLSAHTAHNRLLTFARKPAPIQITGLGAPTTTGLTALDYRLTDAAVDPEGLTERYQSETPLRLPFTAPFRTPDNLPPINQLPAFTNERFTFACLNSLAKISDEVIALWARILRAMPTARLMLGNANDSVRQRLIDTFASHGVRETQLQMHPRMSLQDYLLLHHQIDLALDPFPYNGGITTLHSLSMGVPVIALNGISPGSRWGAGIMINAGLAECVATTKEEYFSLALAFANDLPHLNQIRQTIRQSCQILNLAGHRRFTHHLEQTYRQVWEKWCETRP